MIQGGKRLCMAVVALVTTHLSNAFAANILQTYFAPFPENDMQVSLNVIDAFRGNIGNEIRTVTSMVAGNNGTVIYYDHWEDGYELDISNPTQATTQVWGDGTSTNGIPAGFTSDVVNAGTIINLEDTIDVTRNEVIFEYDGRDKIAATLPITLSRAIYPILPGEYIAESGTALDINLHGTNYIIAAGWGTGGTLYTNEAFEYSALYVMADYDYTYIEVDKDADGIFETTAWLNQGECLFVNGGVRVGARARGSLPFQCHLVTGDIYSNYETRWFTQWPVEKWSTDYYTPVGARTNTTAHILYGAGVFFYNANTGAIEVICETAASTTTVPVAGSSVSAMYSIPLNSGARFHTTNGLPFFASEVVDTVPGTSSQLQDYDWGFSVLPADALTTMGIVGWGPGYGITGPGTVNGSPAWVIAVSNTTLYVDYDGDPSTGPNTDPLGNHYDIATNMTRFQFVQLWDNSDTNQTGMRYYTLDGVKIASAWGEDPGVALPGLPYLDAGNEIMPFPSVLAKKYSVLLIDLNTNGVPDPGDSLEFLIDVYNVGFASANNVTFQDNPPTNTTAYSTNSSYVNGAQIFDDLPPRLTRFPFDEGGYNIGTIDVGATSRVRYVTVIVTAIVTNFGGYIHNNATVGDSNGTWSSYSYTNVQISGMTLTKVSSTTNLLSPGSNFTYTITVANTGQITYTHARLEDYLPEGVTYVAGSTVITYPIGLTNTLLDRFDTRSFTNNYGTIRWLNDWQESREADGPASGYVQVAPDTNVVPLETYALFVEGSNNAAWRSADLSGHESAFLSFKWHRTSLDDANDFVDVFVSTNGWATSNFLVRYPGAGTDTNYFSTNIEISAYISTNTAVRFQSSRSPTMAAGDRLYVDNVQITLTGSNATFAGGAPPLLFNGLSIPPGTSIVVRFDVTVNNPATATQLVNTARVRADQHQAWLYASVTNRVDARASIELFKTNNPNGLVGPGSNILYTIRIVNTGDVTQTGITLEDILPVGVSYVPGSAEAWRPYLHTNTVRDLFNTKAYSNNDGDVYWTGDWTETGDDGDPEAGDIQVANDGLSVPGHVYALRIDNTANNISRLADLGGGYTNAVLSFEYRRDALDAATDYVAVYASSNGGTGWTEVGRVAGPVNDSGYYSSNINISAYIATNTAIRFTSSGTLGATDYIWFDNIRIAYSGSSATNALPPPTTLFTSYTLPPYTSMVVTLRVTVDDPPTATQMVNTARIQSIQHPEWLYASVTNYQNFNNGMSIAKTSSLAGANWPMYYTNTYTITLVNTGQITQTGITVTDALPAGVSYVPGSTVVIAPGLVTNFTTNVTATVITNSVRDEFNAQAYNNNDGTINWSANWTEEGDDGNVAAGDVLVANVLDTWELVTKDNNNGAYRNLNLSGYTNAVLSFDWARFLLDAGDYYAVYVSSNNGTAYTQLIQYNGDGGTDAAYSSTNFDITAFISGTMRIRFFTTDGSIGDEEGMRWDNVQILARGPSAVTNVTTNVSWVAVTNAGDAPPPVASGYTLPTGMTMTVQLKVTLDLPTSYTQFLNTAMVNSLQQGQREAWATDRVARAGIGDFVWYDTNTNGIQNTGEPGISNVTVRLYDGNTNLLATTNTDLNGYYLFSGWPATNYFVEFVAPSNYWFSPRDQGGSDTNDSDADPTTGRTAIFTLTGASNDLTRDAGLYTPPASVGDWIWFDANTNGIQNAGESGVTGVVVRLYTGSSNLVAITTNNATGYYSFGGLQPGEYFIQFTLPSNYVFTLQDQGGSDTNDSDVVQATGCTPIFYLPSGTNDLTWDAGLVRPTSGLRITKASDSGGTCWDPGATGTYTIVVFNTGTFSHVGVTVQDAFPPGVTFVTNSITVQAPGSGFTGTPPTLAYGYTLNAGQAMTVTVRVAIDVPAFTNSLLNVGTAYSATQPSISASVTDCVVSLDLAVTKDVNNPTPSEVSIFEYSVTISNRGSETATGVEIEDVLPITQVQYNSHSNGAYDESAHIWTIGTLPVGSSTTLWINCTVREGTKGLYITNWATLHYLNQIDTVETNNQDDAVIHPTFVILSRFEVTPDGSGALVEWETAYEHGTVGFSLLRKGDGDPDFVRLNERLLPGVITAPQGGIYRFADPSASPDRTYSYRLDEVTMDGTVVSYGPFTTTIPPAEPLKKAAAPKARTQPFTRSVRTSPATEDRVALSKTAAAPAQALAPKKLLGGSGSTSWLPVKVLTEESGVYRLDAATLAAVVGADEADVAEVIASNGVALSIGGEPVGYLADGGGVCFFAEAVDSLYATVNVCRLTWTQGTVMSELGGVFPVPVEGGSFTDTCHAEKDHFALLAVDQDPESDYWYWEYLVAGDPESGSTDYELDPRGVAEFDGEAQLVVRLMGGTATGVTNEHHVTVALNGTPLGEASWTGLAPVAITNTFSHDLLEDDSVVTLTALLDSGAPWSVVYVDSFTLTYRREFKAADDQLLLRGDGNPVVTAFGFSSSNLCVLDVTDPRRPVRLTGVTIEGNGHAYRASFVPRTPDTPYCVYAGGREPTSVSARAPADLLSDTNTARYIVITTPDLAGAAQPLADHRQSENGLPGRVVLLEDIYDGFSAGVEDPAAIRDFLAWAKAHWNAADTNGFYVLLAGEGTFDYLDHSKKAENKVPPKMISTPYGLAASDNWYVDFDEDHVPDMAIGRLPVLTADELASVAANILDYESGEGGAWRQKILLTADDPDGGGNFDASSETVSALAPRDYAVDRVFLSKHGVNEARQMLFSAINSGAAFVNYFGHAGLDRLTGKGLFLSADVPSLTNSNRLPVVVSLTCAMGQFALPGYDCLSEVLLLAKAGAVAVWSPTGVQFNQCATALANNFYSAAFREGEARIGDAIRRAKERFAVSGSALYTLDMYNLLGDPAMPMRGVAFIGAGGYAKWKGSMFTDEELGDPSVSGDGSDPDGDGVANLWEYATGWNPFAADADGTIRILRENLAYPMLSGEAFFEYQRRKGAADVQFVLQSSPSMDIWDDATDCVTGTDVVDDLNGVTETVRVHVKVPPAQIEQRLFLRLAVERD